MRELFSNQRSILLKKVLENHKDIQLVKHAPFLSYSKRNLQELMSHVKEILISNWKDKSTNIRFAHDCIKFIKSRA